jgi:RNA polymerase sigma factor (sigma-70 family)
MTMNILTDEVLIKGLKEQDSRCIRYLYKEFFPLAKSIVERNSGNYEDAEDVFQDSIVVLYKRLTKENLTLKCGLKTFFFGICKNLWMQRLDRKWRLMYSDSMAEEPAGTYEITDREFSEELLEKKRLFQKHFLTLPHRCQKILLLYLKDLPFKTIAKELGLKNEEYAKSRKYNCKNILRKRIMNDPQCKQYLIYD